ncbi:hypothetical protein F383_20807 [Gossypium arboreum]|nr:hypothetical protein F383_20807 [Gossypium arboreum]
MCNFSLT